MKILVIGGGGREHALAWKLTQSPLVQKVFVAPGNAGTAREEGLQNVAPTDNQQVLDFINKNDVALTVVGPEAPLAAGVVDVVAAAGATAIIQPGGSLRDEEVIAAADEHGMAMVFTGFRHFRH